MEKPCIVEIVNGVGKEKSGTGKNGKPYLIREQQAYIEAEGPGGRPAYTEVILSLDEGQPFYTPGKYVFAGSSFFAGEFKSCRFGRAKLVPLATAARAYADAAKAGVV